MAVLFAVGVMNLAWIAALSVFVLSIKLPDPLPAAFPTCQIWLTEKGPRLPPCSGQNPTASVAAGV